MFASAKICFVVGRDGTPNSAAHRRERESRPFGGGTNAGMPGGNHGCSLADGQPH